MIKVLFICHGNICRSPMAEFIFKDMVRQVGLADQFDMARQRQSGVPACQGRAGCPRLVL